MNQTTLTINFGKYKGRSAEWVAENDPKYARWCMEQPWFEKKYSRLIPAWRSVYCPRMTTRGTLCHNAPKYGSLCWKHYAMAEKEMAVRINNIDFPID
jgi:hypothetical protein